jgi:phytoene dehydrogenase-like protein
VTLEDGTFMGADIVVANADLPYAYNNLIHGTGTSSNRWSKKLLQYNYSAGVIAYNWALDKRLKVLRHHNVFLSDFYQESWNRATDPSSLLEQPNFYVHVPAHTDQSAAPADGDAITVLLPVANMGEGYNGDLASCDKQMVDAGRVAILKRLKNSGVGDLAPHILREMG